MKPKIVKGIPAGWICYGMGKQAYGISMQEAYKEWIFKIRLLSLQIPI